ncbi:unnamed protein product [Trifolium pratense]|uniref:Uncharacterized protein n=2 Tax=Trifolium pratense TaxID=57577 RepID=A0ACB0KZS8_TRIPR|nr:unnamed protein product [Trifolium pratense]
MLSLNLFLPVTTTKHFVSIAPACVYSFSLFQNSCQLFDEKPQWHNSEYSQWLSSLPPPELPKTSHRDSTTCESPLQSSASLAPTCTMKLPWFWVKELRIADPILDWEKLKHAIFERLLFHTPPNDNSNATETLTLPPPMTPDQDFQRTKAIVKVFHYYFLIEGYASNFVWGYYDEIVKRLFRTMWINLLNCWGTNLFLNCVYHNSVDEIDGSFQMLDEMLECHICVGNAVFSMCTNYQSEGVSLDFSKGLHLIWMAPDCYTLCNMLLLCSLEFLNFGRQTPFVVKFPMTISLLMNGRWAERELQNNLLEEDWLFIKITSFSCFWPKLFFVWGMRKSFREICSYFSCDGNITLTELVEEPHAIVLLFLLLLQKFGTLNGSFFIPPIRNVWFLSSTLVKLCCITQYPAGDILSTQIYSMMKDYAITIDGWSKAYEDVTLSYHFLLNNHFELHNLKGTVLENMLKEAWVKALGEYKSFRGFGEIVSVSHLAFLNTVRWPKFGALVQAVYIATISDYRHANLVEDVALIVNMMVQSYAVANFWKEDKLDNEKNMLTHVYNSLAWKLCVAPLYASFYNLTKDFLLIFQHTMLVIVLHRKMICKGNFRAPKVLSKLKD